MPNVKKDKPLRRRRRTPAEKKADHSAQMVASARRWNDLCNQLGMAFREAQQEAHNIFCIAQAQED